MREHLYFPYAIHILFFLFKRNALKLLASGSYFESVSPLLLLLNKRVCACMSSQPHFFSIKLLKTKRFAVDDRKWMSLGCKHKRPMLFRLLFAAQ